MTIWGLGMDQAVRFHGKFSGIPTFLAHPVKKSKCLFPRIAVYGFVRPVERLHLFPFDSLSTNSLRVHSRELTTRRDGLRIRARDPVHSGDETKFQSLTSPAVLENTSDTVISKAFSRLPSSVPWNGTTVAVTLVTYLGVVHGPLGVGGLSVVASILHKPDLDPQTKAVSLLILQLLEMVGAVWLVQSTVKEHGTVPSDIFELNVSKIWRNRGWLPTSALCLACLLLVVGVTPNVGECVVKDMDHSNPVLQLVTAGHISRTCFFMVSCLITPCLEEYMYRGFLLTSLAAYFGWPWAILASSGVFVIAHFPVAAGGQVLGLYFIGCLLGTSYVYTGNLVTSCVMHALYNAALLLALSSSSC